MNKTAECFLKGNKNRWTAECGWRRCGENKSQGSEPRLFVQFNLYMMKQADYRVTCCGSRLTLQRQWGIGKWL